jgi:predicted phosphodiesterase
MVAVVKIDEFAAGDELAALQGRLVSEQKAHQRTRRELSRTQERVDELEHLMRRYATVHPKDAKVPKWMRPKGKKDTHRATALLLLSDLHLDEVVDLHEMSGMNAYNRQIAEARLERVVNGAVKMAQAYIAGVKWDGIVCALNGDILSGGIHEELDRTNEAPTAASITYWVPKLASALTHLADEFGKVFVPCAEGNHDRFYKRTPMKKRAESSFGWLLYNWLADVLRDDDRITFSITTSPGQVFEVYDTRFHLIHGDGFRSQGGVGGIYPSMLKYLLRQDAMWGTQGQSIDVHLLGHWHQYLTGPNFIVNGSLKGFDEYAKANGFSFEPPRQAFAVVTPDRGITMQMPIYAE